MEIDLTMPQGLEWVDAVVEQMPRVHFTYQSFNWGRDHSIALTDQDGHHMKAARTSTENFTPKWQMDAKLLLLYWLEKHLSKNWEEREPGRFVNLNA